MKPGELKSLIVDKYFGTANKQNRLKAIEEFNNEAWFDLTDDFCEFIKMNSPRNLKEEIIPSKMIRELIV